MDILIQDQNFSDSFSLHEALLYACEGAVSGSGVFAFVSAKGVELFLEDRVFQEMLNIGEYRLIVGMDAITDTAAIVRLKAQRDQHPNLNVLAYINDSKESIFHPKCCWFKHSKGGTIIVGSGNLTLGGLRLNREMFSVRDVSLKEVTELQNLWEHWFKESSRFLKSIDDGAVIERAERNRRKKKAIRKIMSESVSEEEQTADIDAEDDTEEEGWTILWDSAVLLAEIPKGAGRWNQANFDAETFESFFGATPGKSGQRILLRHVSNDGALQEIESRPSVSVQSKNYRFELSAAAGRSYPVSGRPIGVFAKVSKRVFIYRLVFPGDSSHDRIVKWLNSKWNGRSDRMKRITANCKDVRSIIKALKLESFILNYGDKTK